MPRRKRYPNALLIEGETIECNIRPHKRVFILPVLLALMLLCAVIWLLVVVGDRTWGFRLVLWGLAPVGAIVVLSLALPRYIRWRWTLYTLTDQRMLIRYAGNPPTYNAVQLLGLKTVTHQQGWVERLFGCGSLVLDGTTLTNVPNIYDVARRVTELVKATGFRGKNPAEIDAELGKMQNGIPGARQPLAGAEQPSAPAEHHDTAVPALPLPPVALPGSATAVPGLTAALSGSATTALDTAEDTHVALACLYGKLVARGGPGHLLVVVYRPGASLQAGALIQERRPFFGDTPELGMRAVQRSVPEGTALTVVPHVMGVTFEPFRLDVELTGPLHELHFDLIVGAGVPVAQLTGTVDLLIGPLRIAELPVALQIAGAATV